MPATFAPNTFIFVRPGRSTLLFRCISGAHPYMVTRAACEAQLPVQAHFWGRGDLPTHNLHGIIVRLRRARHRAISDFGREARWTTRS